MTRTRSSRRLDLTVTGVLPNGGGAVPGLTVRSVSELRAFLLPGPRLTDGVVVESGWETLVCETCGSEAHWCPEMVDNLPKGWVSQRRAAELGEIA